jgi:hypothetical protein
MFTLAVDNVQSTVREPMVEFVNKDPTDIRRTASGLGLVSPCQSANSISSKYHFCRGCFRNEVAVPRVTRQVTTSR